MLKLSNIPNEVYYTACEYEDIDITLNQLSLAKKIYEDEIDNRHFTNGGLEKAICDYLNMNGNFNEENGMFYYNNGYIIE